MKLFAAALLVVAAVAGCVDGGSSAPSTTSFVCPNGALLLATFYPQEDRMRLRVNDQDYDLPRLISASGARYGDDSTVFWNKGREAMLQRPNGPPYLGCIAAP